MKAATAVVCAALLTACAPTAGEYHAPAPEMLAHGEGGEPLTTIALRDGWAWPHRLTRIDVVLDGELIHRETLATGLGDQPNRSTRVLERMALPQGAHTLSVRAVANYASTRTDGRDGCRVELRMQRSFEVGDQPVAVRVALESGGLIERFAERVDVRILVDGALADDEVSHAVAQRRVVAPSNVCSDAAPLPFEDDYIEAMRQGPGDWPYGANPYPR